MKDSEMFLLAAHAALSGKMYGALKKVNEYHNFLGGQWPTGSMQDRYEQRCLACCFLSAIAKSEGR